MELDAVNDYKNICGEHFRARGMTVFFDISISDKIRWRPHVFAKNDEELLLDILTQDKIPNLWIHKYIEMRNTLPDLKIYLGIVGESEYFFDVISECAKYGFGIYKIGSTLKPILKAAEPTIEGISEKGPLAIVSNRPYRNILALKKCFRMCKSYLYWLERNLPKKALETLYGAISERDIDGVEEIRLLRAIDAELDDSYRDEFLKFRVELFSEGVSAELRVIKDFAIARTIHGRYIYSIDADKNKLHIKLPPLNSLKANQWDLILRGVEEVPCFEELWDQSMDVQKSWGKIKMAVNEYRERKAVQLERQASDLRKRV